MTAADARQLTLTEATALQLAALAALDDVRAELGPATVRQLRAASAKLNAAIEVLAAGAVRSPPALVRAVRRVREAARTSAPAPVSNPRRKAKQKRDEGKRRRHPPKPHPRRTVVDRKRNAREQ